VDTWTPRGRRYRPSTIFLLLGALLWFLSGLPLSAQTARVRVKTQTANIRATAGMSAAVVATASFGTVLDVVEKAGDWYKIRIPGKAETGYIFNVVVDEVPAAAPASAAPSPSKIRVKVQSANIRAAAGTSAGVVAAAESGAILDVIEKAGDWYRVRLPGKAETGFIFNAVVDEIREMPATVETVPAVAALPAPMPAAPAPIPPQAPSAGPSASGGSEARLERIAVLMQRDSTALLTLVKTMAPQIVPAKEVRQVRKAKIVTASCQVLETNQRGARVIYAPMLNEEFPVLGQVEDMIKVRLRDGREGWIIQGCLQIIATAEAVPKVAFAGIAASERNNFLKVAGDIFSRITQNKTIAEGMAGGSPQGQRAELLGLIRNYYQAAADVFNRYLAGQSVTAKDAKSLVDALSAWANLLAGASSYGNSTLLGTGESKGGLTVDLSAGGALALGDKDRVEVNAAFLSDTIRTPFSTAAFGAGYAYDDRKRLSLRGGVSYNGYSDGQEASNSYGRLGLSGGGRYALSDAAGLDFDYAFLSHGYSDAGMADANYSSHAIRVGGQILQGASRFSFQLRTNIESSPTAFHDSFNFEPSLAYEKSGPESLFRLVGAYERFSFGKLPSLTYGRASAQLTLESFRDSLTRSFDAGLALKSYPDAPAADYAQIKLRYTSSRSLPSTRLFSATAMTDLFSKSPDSSYTDLRLDQSAEGSVLFSNVSLFARVWHSPGWGTASSKPDLVDLTGRLGFNLKYIRVGPTLGIHAAFSSETGVELIKRQGNLFRFGAAAEGTIPLPQGGRLSFSAMYEYGFIYDVPLAAAVGLVARHPTSLLVTGDASLPLGKTLELIARIDIYRIATDLDKTFAYNPATGSTKFKLLAGIRIRHN
jgi:SH3-like domain-containing protein